MSKAIYEITSSTMTHSSQIVSGVVIPVSNTPLYLGQSYIFRVGHRDVVGCIRSVKRTLNSSTPGQPATLLVHPRQLASVDIELTTKDDIGALCEQQMQELMIEQLSTRELVGAGFLMSAEKDGNVTACNTGVTVWFTGLSGAGKTTIAQCVQQQLHPYYRVQVLDGDIIRSVLCRDLEYSRRDRDENVLRLGFLAGLLTQAGAIVLVAAISPYRATRDIVRGLIEQFIEVYVSTPINICEERDIKGLYRRARAGEILCFTGIDDPYEPPLQAEVECDANAETLENCASKVIHAIERRVNNCVAHLVPR